MFVLLTVGAYILYQVRAVWPPFIWGGVLAYLLARPVDWLERRGWTRSGSILTVFFLLGGVLVIVGGLLLPSMVREVNQMGEMLPDYISSTRQWLSDVKLQYENVALPLSVRLAINDAMVSLEASLANTLKGVVEGLLLGYSWIITLVFAPILAYYLLKDSETIKRRFVALLPSAWRGEVIGLLQEIDGVLIGFVKGNLLIALIVGTMATIALGIMGLPYALTLGIIIGLSDLIPYLGPLVGGIPAVAVALLESNRLALYVALMILAIHQIEGGLVAPRILSDRVGLNPFLVVFALLAGGKLWGPLGMVVGVPLAASLRVAVGYVYNRWLGVYPR
ncbi:MAG: AI-2E family transporter [Firmicutes bacterium]|nr:AI-2E family transporter [Bacillota bacterium]